MNSNRHKYLICLFCLLTCLLGTGMTLPEQPAKSGGAGIILRAGTEITFELFENVSSGTAEGGNLIELSVYRPIVVDGQTLINAGRYGEGKVIKARRAGVYGRPGKITVEAISVEAVDGQRVFLYGTPYSSTGRDRRALAWVLSIGLTLGAMVGLAATKSSIFGVAIFMLLSGLLIRGQDVEIPSKTKLSGRVQQDIVIAQ